MWWYKKDKTEAAGGAVKKATTPAERAIAAWSEVLSGRPTDPDALLAMSLLVDGTLVFMDSSRLEHPSLDEAERIVEKAMGASRPLRLYNVFARDYGEGYSRREDVPADHAKTLAAMRKRLTGAAGVSSYK